MLNKFNSNTKRLNRIITTVNFNNLLDIDSITGSLSGITDPQKQVSSKSKRQIINNIPTNINNLLDLSSITASLEGIIEPEPFTQSLSKLNTNQTKVKTTKNIIDTFRKELSKFAARNIYKTVSTIQKTSIGNGESYLNKLIINNVLLDYGIEEPGPENFEIFIDGLHIPGIFSVKQVGSNLEITINEQWIIDDRVTGADISVFGKIKNV